MKSSSKLPMFLFVFVFLAMGAAAEDDFTPVPFPVKIGGQSAKAEKGKTFGQIADPVAADAELEVEIKDKAMVIVNFFPTDAAGKPRAGATPAILMLQNNNKGTINKTLDGKALAPGTYQANIVADSKTAMILFTVK